MKCHQLPLGMDHILNSCKTQSNRLIKLNLDVVLTTAQGEGKRLIWVCEYNILRDSYSFLRN